MALSLPHTSRALDGKYCAGCGNVWDLMSVNTKFVMHMIADFSVPAVCRNETNDVFIPRAYLLSVIKQSSIFKALDLQKIRSYCRGIGLTCYRMTKSEALLMNMVQVPSVPKQTLEMFVEGSPLVSAAQLSEVFRVHMLLHGAGGDLLSPNREPYGLVLALGVAIPYIIRSGAFLVPVDVAAQLLVLDADAGHCIERISAVELTGEEKRFMEAYRELADMVAGDPVHWVLLLRLVNHDPRGRRVVFPGVGAIDGETFWEVANGRVLASNDLRIDNFFNLTNEIREQVVLNALRVDEDPVIYQSQQPRVPCDSHVPPANTDIQSAGESRTRHPSAAMRLQGALHSPGHPIRCENHFFEPLGDIVVVMDVRDRTRPKILIPLDLIYCSMVTPHVNRSDFINICSNSGVEFVALTAQYKIALIRFMDVDSEFATQAMISRLMVDVISLENNYSRLQEESQIAERRAAERN